MGIREVEVGLRVRRRVKREIVWGWEVDGVRMGALRRWRHRRAHIHMVRRMDMRGRGGVRGVITMYVPFCVVF